MPEYARLLLHRGAGGAGDWDSINGDIGGTTVRHGDLVSISGTGFGAMPQFVFAGGDQGRIETAPFGPDTVDSDGWLLSTERPKFVVSDSVRGKAWRANISDGVEGTADNGVIAHDWGSAIPARSKVFLHWYTKLECDATHFQWKHWRQEPSYNYTDGGPESYLMFWKKVIGRYYGIRPMVAAGTARTEYLNGSGYDAIRIDGAPEWFGLDVYQQLSDPGATNGIGFIQAFSASQVATTLKDLSNIQHFEAGVTERPRWQVWQNYLGNFNEGQPTVGRVWMDDIYIQVAAENESLVRVYLCDSANFSTATVREIQRPWTGWTDTSARVRINRGGLTSGQAWLHVVADKNTVIASQEINLFVQEESGGTDTLSWFAPNGLADGELITLASNTHTFVQPDKFAYLGFGDGWLYESALNDRFITHSVETPHGIQSIVAEDPPSTSRRRVYELNGARYLRSLVSGASADVANSGFINWDYGANIAALNHAFQYSRARITPRPEDAAKLFQVKQNRIGGEVNLGTADNSCYVKQGPGTLDMATDAYFGNSGSAQAYYFGNAGQQSDGLLTDFAWSWTMNTPDAADGDQWVMCAKNGTFTRDRPDFSGGSVLPNNIIRSTSALRPRWLKWQDYLGNDSSVVDLEILRTDMFMQVGGSIFFIADNPDPALCNNFCPLIPVSYNGGNNWTFMLWKGGLADYSNAAIFMMDKNFNLLAGISL